eukprot:g14131.t1
MVASVAGAALALYLVAAVALAGCLAGEDNDWTGDSSSEPLLRASSPHHLEVPPQGHNSRADDTVSYSSWPLAIAAADRSLDRSLPGKLRALPGAGGRSTDRRVALTEEHLPAPARKLEILTGVTDAGKLPSPSLEESTVMFLHIFKCAGSTTRRMMVAWAEAEGQQGAVVVACDNPQQEDKICLNQYGLLDETVQSEIISRQRVLAGHFLWGFQEYVRRPYLMITALRNPLEVFVSAKQYIHRKKTKTLEKATNYISKAMVETLGMYGVGPSPSEAGGGSQGYAQPQIGGFIFRLVGKSKNSLRGELLETATAEAIRNLDSFWVVGVVEQFAGFEEVLRRLLDPSGKYDDLWGMYSTRQFNTSPVGSRDVLATIDTGLVQHFNNSLKLQWDVYAKAVAIWGVRCREVLPSAMHQEMCAVTSPPSKYGS